MLDGIVGFIEEAIHWERTYIIGRGFALWRDPVGGTDFQAGIHNPHDGGVVPIAFSDNVQDLNSFRTLVIIGSVHGG
jgi:hypothetical protein